MQNIKVYCFGKLKDKYLEIGIKEYEKRISSFANLEQIVLKDEKISKAVSIDLVKNREAERVLSSVSNDEFLVVLDEKGEGIDSIKFSNVLSINKDLGRGISFVIGGAYGIAEVLKQKADLVLSLSKLTFTHQMVRIILAEQIWRGLCILNGKEYHI